MKSCLVLEGGGMRGAYTAGALTWLIDKEIEFDKAYGISTGAVHLCNFLLKDKKNLFDFAIDYIADKKAIGLSSLIRCGHLVDYRYLFNNLLLNKAHFSFEELHKTKNEGYVGLYELNEGYCRYKSTREICLEELKAATTLPLIGGYVQVKDRKILDGGISEMIPIKQAIKDNCDVSLIITTKPKDYVRKPAKGIVVKLMSLVYSYCPNLAKDYQIRHLNYNDQINRINDLVKDNKAIYIYPSKTSKVTRLGGKREDLIALFKLGYQDMEERKDEIFKLLGKNV